MNKKVLFLVGDIWDLGKNKGMPSVFKVLEKSQEKFKVDIFTTDQNRYDKELHKSEVYYFKKISFLNTNNRYLQYINSRINNLILNLKYIYKFVKLNKKFDLIYCSSSIPIYATYFIKKFYKVKTIHRIYGTFLYPNLGSKLDALKKFEEVLSFKLEADKYIITDDGTLGDKVAEYYKINSKDIVFLRNGVNKIAVNKEKIIEKFKMKNEKFYCLCVSRLTGWKRVDRIISAFNKINNDNIVLFVVGDGDEKENLEAMSHNKNIIFLGSLPAYEVHGLMQVCDLFISMYDLSNIGNPLLEALSYNMPIITYNSGNTKEVINGNNGILIDEEDEDKIVNQLYKNILKLYSDSKLREKLKEGAKEYAGKYIYTWNERIEKEIEIINEVISLK